jgi:hypothetical protein
MDASEHLGFRAQVYESESNSEMDLLEAYNIDIIGALNAYGYDVSLADLEGYVAAPVEIRIRANMATGKVMVMDPTNPSLWFSFSVQPSVLWGNYVSLRTNSLAVSFSDFTVRQR